MLLAVVIWAAYSFLLRRRPADLPPAVTLASSIAALIMMLPLLILGAPAPVAALGSPSALLSIFYIALFASAVAFLLWSHGVSRLGPARADQFAHLMPVFGAALALAVLGDVPTSPQTAGAVLVLSGIAFGERGPAPKNRRYR